MQLWPANSWYKHRRIVDACLSSHYFFEAEWDVYLLTTSTEGKFDALFVHRETGIEFTQTFDHDQWSKIQFDDTLIRNQHFINWMGGL